MPAGNRGLRDRGNGGPPSIEEEGQDSDLYDCFRVVRCDVPPYVPPYVPPALQSRSRPRPKCQEEGRF